MLKTNRGLKSRINATLEFADYSREELLETIWGRDYPGDERTVDVHIRRLREKLETNPSEPRYVRTKWGSGYYFQA